MKISNISFFLSLLLIVLLQNSCNKNSDITVPVTGKVIEKGTQKPVQNARVIYNAGETVATDNFGEFRLEYKLGKFLADSIALYVSHPTYKDANYANIVGNTQKDIFVIEVEAK